MKPLHKGNILGICIAIYALLAALAYNDCSDMGPCYGCKWWLLRSDSYSLESAACRAMYTRKAEQIEVERKADHARQMQQMRIPARWPSVAEALSSPFCQDEHPHPLYCPIKGRYKRQDMSGAWSNQNEVFCWPSKGGVLAKTIFHPPYLDFLGLNRFTGSYRSDNGTEEDIFCNRLKLLAPEYYPSQEAYGFWEQHRDHHRYQYDKPEDYGMMKPEPKLTCWLDGGGVWVLDVEKDSVSMGNARDMEGLCRAMEGQGGEYFANTSEPSYMRHVAAQLEHV